MPLRIRSQQQKDTHECPYLSRFPVLIIDDEQDVLQSYAMMLQLNKINNLVLCSTAGGYGITGQIQIPQ